MKILICVKRVTDPDTVIGLSSDGSGPDFANTSFVISAFDERALEEALRMANKLGETEIVIVSIGSEVCQEQIRTALAMGADRGILVKTDMMLDSDSVARILAKVYEQENPDLVLMGKQSPDDDSCQAAQILAELLGLPQALFAAKIEISADKSSAIIVREVDCGKEIVEVVLPAIITVDLGINEPRYASLPMIMKAKNKPIDEDNDLGLDLTPKVEIVGFVATSQNRQRQIVETPVELIEKLVEVGVL